MCGLKDVTVHILLVIIMNLLFLCSHKVTEEVWITLYVQLYV
jgi:hypothetical protein